MSSKDNKFILEPCRECGYKITNQRSLGNHLVRKHKSMTTKDYHLKHYYNGIPPVCECGCGQETTWLLNQNRYRRYVNGHNCIFDGFSATNQPKLTQEQIDYRNSQIKKTYEENGKEISKKISESVLAVNQTEEYKKNHREGIIKSWDDEERRKQASEHFASLWRRPGHHAKVFTESMRRKISEANSRRENKRISKEEISFVEILKRIFGEADIHHSAWMNSDFYWRACFDVYIKSLKLYVEYDGVYWHGLIVGKKGLTRDVKHNMRNDVRKNNMILESNSTLLRVRSDSNWRKMTTKKDLIDLNYHFISNDENELNNLYEKIKK